MKAYAKLNLALLVGPLRDDGKHEVATVLQRLELCDEVEVERAERGPVDVQTAVEGASPPIVDNIVARALVAISREAAVEPAWRASIDKRIPVAAGLGGGSSDAAAALRLANGLLDELVPDASLRRLARALGADVPFFLATGPQLGTGDGSTLHPVDPPQAWTCLLLLPDGAAKESTATVYGRYEGEHGFAARRARLLDAIEAGDLAALPPNDLVSSPFATELRGLGAFRADVTGAGPVVYGLFRERRMADAAAATLAGRGRTWITEPAW